MKIKMHAKKSDESWNSTHHAEKSSSMHWSSSPSPVGMRRFPPEEEKYYKQKIRTHHRYLKILFRVFLSQNI